MAGRLERPQAGGLPCGCARRTEGEGSGALARERLTEGTPESGLHAGGSQAQSEKGDWLELVLG